MPGLCEAQLRHARYYEAVLRAANQLYLEGGRSFMRSLAVFDLEWANIQLGQAQAETNASSSYTAARLCSDYPYDGARCWISANDHSSAFIG